MKKIRGNVSVSFAAQESEYDPDELRLGGNDTSQPGGAAVQPEQPIRGAVGRADAERHQRTSAAIGGLPENRYTHLTFFRSAAITHTFQAERDEVETALWSHARVVVVDPKRWHDLIT